jgi:hypothetical protein
MKVKDSYKITDLFFNKTILDLDPDLEDDSFEASEYLFFVKDTNYEGDLNNKLTLIIISKDDGYVVNNNLKFNSIELNNNKITIYIMVGNKRKEIYYWLKK